MRGIHRWPVNSPHKGPVTRKMFPFNDIMVQHKCRRVWDLPSHPGMKACHPVSEPPAWTLTTHLRRRRSRDWGPPLRADLGIPRPQRAAPSQLQQETPIVTNTPGPREWPGPAETPRSLRTWIVVQLLINTRWLKPVWWQSNERLFRTEVFSWIELWNHDQAATKTFLLCHKRSVSWPWI